MPIYDFECKKCEHEYDVICLMSEKEETVKKTKCPECGSRSKLERLYAPSFNFTNPVGTDRYNKHDYRHKHNMERPGGVVDQRKHAEENSHVGPTPYNEIDDISSGDHFGEVK
jgi:putative FmdB family regulatory protein